MKTFLFIDDERFPSDVTWSEWRVTKWGVIETSDGARFGGVRVVRNYDQVIAYIEEKGMPNAISFDHDLGDGEKTGYDIIKKIVEMDMDSDFNLIPSNTRFFVHSKNPVGANNIKNLISNYLEKTR